GYCSAMCSTDADCGPLGECVSPDVGNLPNYCLARCSDATTCRHPGYACFSLDRVCLPDTDLDCTPTDGDGTRQALVDPKGPRVAGGCVRQAFEDMNGGRCFPTCKVATGSCQPDVVDVVTTHCVYLDTSQTPSGRMTGDKYRGLVCQADVIPAVPD